MLLARYRQLIRKDELELSLDSYRSFVELAREGYGNMDVTERLSRSMFNIPATQEAPGGSLSIYVQRSISRALVTEY